FSFYVTVAWLSEILNSYGLDLTLAGWLVSLVVFIGIPATFAAPLLAERLPNQQKLVLFIGALYLAGLGGLLIFRDVSLLVLSIIVLGLGQGASMSLIFTLFVLRTVNAQQAAELSGMAQSIGYLLAAIGPMMIGWLFDLTYSWVVPIIFLMVIAVLMTLAGYGAGRDRYVLPVDNSPACMDRKNMIK
ncbi:MAG: MFS transporter, partial [Desulfitobacteriaceae bacterium]|nr:MFS transporter [Desulfitobacteriaceae bacterium]